MKEKELLAEQLSKLNNIELEKLSEWRTETLPIISEIFNQKSSQYSQFCNIGCLSMQGYTNSHLNQFKKKHGRNDQMYGFERKSNNTATK